MPAMQSPQGARAQGGKDACLRRDCMAHKSMPAQETGRTPRTHSTRPTTNNGQSGGVHHSSPKRVRRVGCQVGFAHIPHAPGSECEREEDDGCDQQHGSVLDVKGFLDVPPPGRNATRAAVNLPADQGDQQHLGPHFLSGDLWHKVNQRFAVWVPWPIRIGHAAPRDVIAQCLAAQLAARMGLHGNAKTVGERLKAICDVLEMALGGATTRRQLKLLRRGQALPVFGECVHAHITPCGVSSRQPLGVAAVFL